MNRCLVLKLHPCSNAAVEVSAGIWLAERERVVEEPAGPGHDGGGGWSERQKGGKKEEEKGWTDGRGRR